MSINEIPATTQTEQEATEALSFDKWFLTNLVINSDPTQSRLNAVFVKGNKSTDGTWSLSEEKANLMIPNLFEEASEDAGLEAVLNAVLSALTAKGVEAGVL